jgi:dihydroorotate dehydrogenase
VRVEDVFPLVGAGGIDSGASALGKIRAGASLVQVYSGLVFRGLGLVAEIKRAIVAALERDHAQSLVDYVGSEAAAVTAEPWPA